jgi:hypothetical protein
VKSVLYRIGDGNLILSCTPLIYTNYGVLRDTSSTYIQSHLAYLKNRPLMRTEYYQVGSQSEYSQSEFRFLLSEPPLKWAFYIVWVCVLIFMVFTARRKQKTIPVIHPPANKMISFVRAIAGLYFQRNNNADLVLKKQVYWADNLKRKYGINVMNENWDTALYKRVASKTGAPFDEVRSLFINLSSIDKDLAVSDEDMMQLITIMNNIK